MTAKLATVSGASYSRRITMVTRVAAAAASAGLARHSTTGTRVTRLNMITLDLLSGPPYDSSRLAP